MNKSILLIGAILIAGCYNLEPESKDYEITGGAVQKVFVDSANHSAVEIWGCTEDGFCAASNWRITFTDFKKLKAGDYWGDDPAKRVIRADFKGDKFKAALTAWLFTGLGALGLSVIFYAFVLSPMIDFFKDKKAKKLPKAKAETL